MISGAVAGTVLVCGITIPFAETYIPGGTSRMIPIACPWAMPAVRHASMALIAACFPAAVAGYSGWLVLKVQ
jgi:hypothetical protein